MLDQKTFITVKHFYDLHRAMNKEGRSVMYLSNVDEHGAVSEDLPIYVGPENVQPVLYGGRETDVVLCKLRTEFVSRAKDIRHFIREECNSELLNRQVAATIIDSKWANGPGKETDFGVRVTGSRGSSYAPNAVFLTATGARTRMGDCGRPYVLDASSSPRPIIGIHAFMSEFGSLGFAPVCSDGIRDAEAKCKVDVPVIQREDIPQNFAPGQVNKYWDTSIEYLGRGEFNGMKMAMNVASETKLRRLTYRGKNVLPPGIECDFEPTAQRAARVGDAIVHPVWSNCQKFAIQQAIAVPPFVHDDIVSHYVAKFEKDRPRKLWSTHEAINGILPMKPVCMGTSSGYWTMLGFKGGKREFFDPEEQEIDAFGQVQVVSYCFSQKAKTHVVPLYGQTFVQRLETVERNAREGISPFSLWVTTMKDELRSKKKVEAVKTRLFEQPGLELVLLYRKYFGDFLNYMKSRPGPTLHHAIGIDAEVQWAEIYKALASNSMHWLACDYSNWDGSFFQAGFQFFLDVTDSYYGTEIEGATEMRNARHALVDSLRHAYHLHRDEVYVSNQGNKSGNAFTDVFNSVGNIYVQYLCWWLGMSRMGLRPDFCEYDRSVVLFTYGDDFIASVKPHALRWYNMESIQELLLGFGFVVTDALKTGVMTETIDPSEATFLKRGFRWEDGVCYGPLPMSDIVKELKYAPKAMIGDDMDLQQRCMVTQRFACHVSEETLKNLQSNLIDQGLPKTWLTTNYSTVRSEIAQSQESAQLY
jgi:hypothetical protein